MRQSTVVPKEPVAYEAEELGNMSSVVMPKTELLAILRKNREEHRTIYEEAKFGFEAAFLKELKSMAKQAKKGNFRMQVNLEQPINFLDDYDKAILMLEHTQRDPILLQVREFESYVQDKWNWHNAFSTSNAAYSRTAQSLGGKYVL